MAILVCLTFVDVNAQVQGEVKVSVHSPSAITVEAALKSPARSWSFRNAYAGVLGMAERVEEFRATGESGQDVAVKKIATGEFRSELPATTIMYTVKLSEPGLADLPHVSWLAADRGLLMFADLIPLDIESVSAAFVLPAGWSVESSIARDANGKFELSEAQKAVFIIGSTLHKTSRAVEGMNLDLVLSGTWPFKEKRALDAATRVMKHYLELTGFRLPDQSIILIAPFPVSAGSIKWKSETRGSTVILLIDPAARIESWIGQLGVIFTHEMLHLWVPNSLKLEGDYDWFFEGFTMYMALRTALELKIINFNGFLVTLAGVYDAYVSQPDDLSLIEASERRWTSTFTPVYVKGMLVAFLYDLMVRKESGGKTSLAARYRELFSGRVADNANGNEAIIALLLSPPAMSGFAKTYIESSKMLELESILPTYGLQLNSSGQGSELRVGKELGADQKQLLRSLGYRN